MKKNSKLLMLFLAAVLLAGCANNSMGSGKNDANRGNAAANGGASKAVAKLKPVEGATIGSVSYYVEDREVWKDFVDEKYSASAKRGVRGIHVPRILLDSEDAAAANKQIDAMVKHMKDTYAEHEKEMEGFDTGICASFSAYQDEDVLSVMIENYDIWEQGAAHYTVFNFSLPDGKFMDDDALMKHFGVEKGELSGLIENSLVEAQDLDTSLYFGDVTDTSYFYNPSSYTGLVLNNLWDKGEARDRRIFLDEVGAPTFVCAQSIDPDEGPCPPLLKLRADKFDADPLSEVYVRMARKLGVDPEDENHKAFIIHLGAAFDEASLKETLAKLHAWTGVFTNWEDPNMLISVKESEGGDRPCLNGEECYLVIPKYKNASVSLKELEISEAGKLKEVDNPSLDTLGTTGATFICQNISETAPNGKITIRFRDDITAFSPSISLKDGSMMLPDEVTDAEAVLNWKDLVEEEGYSNLMFKRFMSVMGKG
ncbi:hypothetical protein [Aedoeadaptatus coli]|uniref:hypothetical protein n=1 Tax=Aedoeadaptatus coli TaxID=2058292 RepID=UPI000D553C60|nr:hypothetical protein [Peptoniphilus coli]